MQHKWTNFMESYSYTLYIKKEENQNTTVNHATAKFHIHSK